MTSGYRVGIDIGGTFTDFVLIGDATGALRLHKRLTTPADPAEGAIDGLRELLGQQGLALADVRAIVHGTTLVTNAIIERRGARTALLTTRGFRDILEMGHEQRYDIYDLFLRYPEPLAPRRWRVEVDERMDRDGTPLRAPDLDQVADLVAALVEQGVEALAICLLHAYRNPAHERAVADLVRARFPRLAVSVSSEVVPEIREYERSSATMANA
jgi:N-methylhydantoinase A/oxoprolinase/acetone carboxylase beta subunit